MRLESREHLTKVETMSVRGLPYMIHTSVQRGPPIEIRVPGKLQLFHFHTNWAHFVAEDFQLFHFHTGRPILITPEG